MKQCNKCDQWKPLDAFHCDKAKKDGHRRECKDCSIARVRAYRQTDSGQKTGTAYRTSPSRKTAFRKYNASDKSRLVVRKYGKSPKGKDRLKQYWIDHPEQKQAGNAVRQAVHRGQMPSVSTLACIHCGIPAQSYHHHMGYAIEHRLDVVPLCAKCHRRADRDRRA